MNDLAAWLLEQIAEDEFRYQRARLAGEAGPNMTSLRLAECEAKRRIVALHHEYQGVCPHDVDALNLLHRREAWPCHTLRLLALPYADRDGYREEWRPTVVAA